MPANAKTHEENRLKVCVVCFTKGSRVVKVTGKNFRRIKEYFLENYDPTEDVRLPAGICARCEKLLLRIEKGESTVESLPQPYDFSKVAPVVARTRADPSRLCACELCLVARSNPFTLGVGKGYSALVKPQRGRPNEPKPSTSASSEDVLPSPGPMVICKRCWQPIGRGIQHPNPCTVKDAQQNLVANLKLVPQAAEIATSDVLRQKFETSDGSSIKIRTRGKDLKIKRPLKSVSKALFSTRSVSSDEVNRFQSTLGLSLKQTEKALVFFRSWKGRD
ncbi:hypothetical protein SNE40_013257 [Patella caerulea]|uniref:Uncharacterized protein n=1 Tax=Patella caerulea TaxID=87958 RepID=A0AAN8JHT2_PATCE